MIILCIFEKLELRYSPWICPFLELLSRLPQLEKLVFQARIIYDSEVENLIIVVF